MTQHLKIYRPLITNKVTQPWGVNRACVTDDGRIIGTRSTCPRGSRPYYPTVGMNGHNGFDYRAIRGERIFHACLYDGIASIEKDYAGGIGVNVTSSEPVKLKDGREVYVKARYWHLKCPLVHDGQKIKLGQVVGLADNTGASSSDHLHFGLKAVDKDGRQLDAGNGYNGAFDPTPYLDNTYDAVSAAEYLYMDKPIMTPQERKEMLSQLSSAKKLLLAMQELRRRL